MFKYKLVRSKRKTIALEITGDGQLVVRSPLRVSIDHLHKIILNKSSWIVSKLDKARQRASLSNPKKFLDGEKFLFLGNEFELKVIDGTRGKLKFNNGFILPRNSQAIARKLFREWYISEAKKILFGRLEYFTKRLGLEYKKIKITSANKRWGSCSSRGTICFSWRLVMAPPAIIDYVVVHEAIHLDEKNHSRKFWNKVKMAYPDYGACRSWLKEYGYKLTI